MAAGEHGQRIRRVEKEQVYNTALLLAFVPLKGLRKCPKKGQMDAYF